MHVCRYISEIRKHRANGRRIYYLDESYIHSSHSMRKNWHDTKILSRRHAFVTGRHVGNPQATSKGKRLIIGHTMSENGLLQDGELVWESGKPDPLLDYHKVTLYNNL